MAMKNVEFWNVCNLGSPLFSHLICQSSIFLFCIREEIKAFGQENDHFAADFGIVIYVQF